MQTFEEIRQAALARLAEFTDQAPSGRQVPYRRIGVRQQELYAIAADLNPEYSGDCAIGDVDEGACDLKQMEDAEDVANAERITKVLVKARSTEADGSWPVGTEVHIIAIGDPDAADAPRATLRRGVIRGYAGELDKVSQLEVYYPYRPEPTAAAEDGTREVEIPDPHSELLVIDLCRDYVRKAMALDMKDRTAIIAMLAEEEEPMLARWGTHVQEYAPVQSRFARPPQARKA